VAVQVSVGELVVARPLGWRMWLPCLGMALCSWLSFVDRQVLAVLAPTILRETGMSAQDFGNVVFFFFVAYTISSPIWGSLLDFVGLRAGMLLAVGIWSVASTSHAWMSGVVGFAAARALLGLGEGAAFPGGLRTAVESLPSHLRARGIATAFSGGTVGAIVTPLIFVPFGLRFGWRAAFILTGVFGALWLILWAAIARPPYLPKTQHATRKKMSWPNPLERRFWTIVFSYSLTAMSAGPILTLVPIYLNRRLGVSQAELAGILWMPPLAWGFGYFFWGWLADRYADKPRPVGMLLLLTALALPFGLTTLTTSVPLAMVLISSATFVAGGFQMVALKAGSHVFSREQAAMMSGIATGSWSLVNAIVSPIIGRLFDQQRWAEAFWLIALCPAVGIAVWLFLSRGLKSSSTAAANNA
jgi:ACS family hexuronate transporter-like MFS transporter